jgi:hypothetical protein
VLLAIMPGAFLGPLDSLPLAWQVQVRRLARSLGLVRAQVAFYLASLSIPVRRPKHRS